MSEKTLYRFSSRGSVQIAIINRRSRSFSRLILTTSGASLRATHAVRSRNGAVRAQRDPIFRVARVFYSARVHKRAICINPSVDLRATSLLDSLGQFLLVRPDEFAELDESGLQFAYIGSDADQSVTPRNLRRCLVAIDPEKTNIQPHTEAGRLRPLFLLKTPAGLLCARVGPGPTSSQQLLILPEPRESAEPLRYSFGDITILGQVREEPLLQIVLPPDEPHLKS